MRYFIGNWKMFGTPKSAGILHKINNFIKRDKNNNKYHVIITPPYTLLQSFSKIYKNKKIDQSAMGLTSKAGLEILFY